MCALSVELAGAQDTVVPLVTDRPDQTESALTVPKNSVQIETGWSVAGFGGASAHAFLGTLLRYGAGPTAELRFGFGGLNRTPAGTWEAGEIEIGFKQRVYQGEGTIPNIAFLVHVVIPPGGGRFLPNIRASLSHDLSDRLSTGYNLGIAAIDGGTRTEAAVTYTWSLGAAVAEKVAVFAEVFGATPVSRPAENATSLDGGFTFLFSPRIQLDVSAGLGLTRTAEDWLLGAGLSLRLPK